MENLQIKSNVEIKPAPMMSSQTVLKMYTDLTPGQLEALRQACHGELHGMDKPRREALAALIDKDFTITDWGRLVLVRAEAIIDGTFEIEYHPVGVVNFGLRVKQLRMRHLNLTWLKVEHLKIILELFERPRVTFKHLMLVHGYRPLYDLAQHGLMDGELRFGYACQLTGDGNRLAWEMING